MPSSGVLSSATGVSSLSWGNINGNVTGTGQATYQRPPHIDPEWGFVQASSSDARYSHSHQAPLSQMSPTESGYLDSVGPMRHRSNRAPTRPRQTKTKVASAYIPRQQKVKVSRRSGPLEDQCKAKAHKMRKTRVCVRCKMYKAGCDEGDPCQKCAKTMGSARSFLEPCFRDSIEDMGLVRHCNGRCNQAEADFLKYVWQEAKPIHQMEILWFLPGKQQPIRMAQPLRLRYRPFHPDKNKPESTMSVWKNTEEAVITFEHAPYAVFDTTALQPDVESYFFGNLPSMERWIYSRIGRDEIALLTYREAFRLRGNGNTLNAALHLQCLSIMSQGYGVVYSPGIPGIETVDFTALGHADYEAYDRNGRDQILPAAMNHQMDVAFVKLLRRLEHDCHKLLHNKVFKPKIKPWYELHLTFFILCWNLGYISQGATKYLQSKRGIITPSVISQQIKKWEYTYEVILKYWRSVLRGFVPFKLARENEEELHENGQLPDQQAFEYMRRVIEVWDRTGTDRHKPPLTGLSSTLNSMENCYISELFKIAGA
ncbi:hypothetical protein B0J11DRAFT_552853 [Dendryphion nanum]|uniref:Zn(2)-C6 fungal-type domain-containing protein n=1 Tax=Dendryphion nanum TaxID=256645 RepID=A0A9P9ICV7_9PLEO|nr:hypothetical protein B0J11DRAFT_552853 [Dendryphion nanum]